MHADGATTWGAPRTFFGVPSVRDLDSLDAHIAFLGVPYDGGTPQPFIPTGQSMGPAAARQATAAQIEYPDGGGSPSCRSSPTSPRWGSATWNETRSTASGSSGGRGPPRST